MADRSENRLWNIPSRLAEDFCYAFLGLMPRGFAWFKGSGGNWNKLFSGFSEGFLAAYDMFRQLIRASSPVSTNEFDVWEEELGLPKDGFAYSDSSFRKKEIIRISRDECGNTVSYFQTLLEHYGIEADIYQYWKNPEKFADVDFDDNDDPNFFWMIEIVTGDENWFECTCNDTCNDYLQCWWDTHIETLFNSVKPAHTKIVYTYNYQPRVYLIDDQGDYVIDENGDRVVTY